MTNYEEVDEDAYYEHVRMQEAADNLGPVQWWLAFTIAIGTLTILALSVVGLVTVFGGFSCHG